MRKLATSAASADDSTDDAQITGEAPTFVEIVRGEVVGLGDDVALSLIMSGEVPTEMPDDATYMLVSWNLAPSKKHPTVGFTAQAGADGWTIATSVDNEIVEYPGRLLIDGNRISLLMPWKFLRDPHGFRWSAAAVWGSNDPSSPAGSGDNITDGRFP